MTHFQKNKVTSLAQSERASFAPRVITRGQQSKGPLRDFSSTLCITRYTFVRLINVNLLCEINDSRDALYCNDNPRIYENYYVISRVQA